MSAKRVHVYVCMCMCVWTYVSAYHDLFGSHFGVSFLFSTTFSFPLLTPSSLRKTMVMTFELTLFPEHNANIQHSITLKHLFSFP